MSAVHHYRAREDVAQRVGVLRPVHDIEVAGGLHGGHDGGDCHTVAHAAVEGQNALHRVGEHRMQAQPAAHQHQLGEVFLAGHGDKLTGVRHRRRGQQPSSFSGAGGCADRQMRCALHLTWGPTRPGCCARRSPTICYAPPVSWPEVLTRWPAQPPAPQNPHRPGSTGPAATPIRPAPTHALAPGHTSLTLWRNTVGYSPPSPATT